MLARRARATLPATDDRWLDRWSSLIGAKAAGLPVLELGCGSGADSATLSVLGHQVVGIDLSADEIAKARARVPSGIFHCQDVRAPFPVTNAGVVVASLSLHYFPWLETVDLVRRIHDVLRPQGLVLCRLNSTNDHHFGASGHPEISENYFNVDGEPKRFFDLIAVKRLFASGWRMLTLGEKTIARYDRPKVVWEVILERLP